MPFIGGRYYMNPLFGAAVERSRLESDVLPDENSASSASEVKMPVAEETPRQQRSKTPSQEQKHKAEVGYGETSGLIPEKARHAEEKFGPYDRQAWDQKSARDLQEARTHIMDISERNHRVHMATPSKDTVSETIWDDNMRAAEKSTGSLPGNHFFIRHRA